MFTLNTKLIPALNRDRIKFRYIGGVYDTRTIIITHKHLDICRVDLNPNYSNEPYNYFVYWFNIVGSVIRCRERYALSEDLISDIKIAIKDLESKGDNKMDKKKYKVKEIEYKSGPDQLDEIILTVDVLHSNCSLRDDWQKIREAVESIGDTNETHYIVCGRGNGKTKMFMNDDYHGGFTTWPNEYQKERDKFGIKDVIFNNPATIVLWADGTKTVVKAENEEFDPEKGFAMAIAKKALGGKHDYYDVFKKYVGRYEKKQKKGEK